MTPDYKLTEYAHGAGCGCKIAPAVLEKILHNNRTSIQDENLLVGNDSNDDAAVYDMGNGTALIATNDFFMPIVDDPFTFGQIASANAISDIYAMGGKPFLATAILGWPVEKLSAEAANKVIEGGRSICNSFNISLAGGHSIDSPEPFFGLSVNGSVEIKNLKRNNTAQAGDLLYITKPVGTGILSTAHKRKVISEQHYKGLIKNLTLVNSIGADLARIEGVNAMTDITGFGLLGHLIEMAEGSSLSAEIYFSKIPLLDGTLEYLSRQIIPDATYKNWNNYSSKTGFEDGMDMMKAFSLLPDPQTNGGLLIAVHKDAAKDVENLIDSTGMSCQPIGKLADKQSKIVIAKN
jgi:selenide,water dikinase